MTDSLLLHQLGEQPLQPRLMTVQHPLGGWGVALVIDGWYADRDMAATALDYWTYPRRSAAHDCPRPALAAGPGARR